MNTYALMVLGCKVNDYEATYVREKLNNYYDEVDFKNKADVYIIFTCCVTNIAEAKTRKFIRQARRNNKDAYIVAVGCLSQIKPDSEIFNEVDLIIGSNNKNRLIELILARKKANLVNKTIDFEFEDLDIETYPTKSRSFLKIQDGCNQYCSYCIIPFARGKERSNNHLNVITQAKKLAKINPEIVLTGIHTGRYNDGEYNLYDLLNELVKIEELETIRLSSIEITEISDEIIELMKNNDKLAHHLHIPVQSLDDKILKLMNRPYTVEEYKNRINYIRNQIPNISISTDLIVGFPDEDEISFNKTLENIKDIQFSFIHVFPYSAKTNTLASKMANQVASDIKKDRVRQIIDLSNSLAISYKKQFINKQVKVLIEKNDNEYSYGYCKEYFYIKINGIYEAGTYLNVIIDSVDKEVIAHVAF